MRVLVCGSRNWTDRQMIMDVLRGFPKDTVIIEGEARGADSLAASVAEELGLEVMRFPADWARWGRGAGHVRNKQMLVEGKPDQVIAFTHDLEKSTGTRNMVALAIRENVPVSVRPHGYIGEFGEEIR